MGKRGHHLREVSEEEVAQLRTLSQFTDATLSDGAARQVDCQHD